MNGHSTLTGGPVEYRLYQGERSGAKQRTCHPTRRAWEANPGLCIRSQGGGLMGREGRPPRPLPGSVVSH